MARDQISYKYDDVNVVLLDQNIAIRRLIRSAMSALGFVNITEVRSVDEAISALNTVPVDLLCLDLDVETDKVCKAIREVRNNRAGPNPFVVIIAMTWQPKQDVVMRTLNSGTDDLVTKPVSAQKLLDRVTRMVRERKNFVVAPGYIGPDRRLARRPGRDDLPTIRVPNTLRHKAAEDPDAALTKESIKAAMDAIKTHRVYRMAMQIGAMAQKLEQRTAHNRSSPIPRQHLSDLASLVNQTNRMIEREGMPHLQRVATSMGQVMDSVMGNVYQTPRHFEVLRLHAHGIVALIREDDRATDIIITALNKAVDFIEQQRAVS